MVSEKRIYAEGGGDSKEMHARCREGFRKLLEKSGFTGRVPRIVACGGRNDALDAFKTAHTGSRDAYVALIVDSEDPVVDREKPWEHLAVRDRWERPDGARDDQVFLMTTCMETWILADRAGLKKHYGSRLQESALPSDTDRENRPRHNVQDSLMRATAKCTNAYAKNKRSFDALAAVDPAVLESKLPAFARMRRILNEKL